MFLLQVTFVVVVVVEVLLYVHRNRRFMRDGEPRTATSTFTHLLSSANYRIQHPIRSDTAFPYNLSLSGDVGILRFHNPEVIE